MWNVNATERRSPDACGRWRALVRGDQPRSRRPVPPPQPPALTPIERIARANNISLRYLHLLFGLCEMSASEWLWHRRLQRAYDLIAKGDGQSITEIAFALGFSSSAHVSTMFRRTYGVSPRDVGRSRR